MITHAGINRALQPRCCSCCSCCNCRGGCAAVTRAGPVSPLAATVAPLLYCRTSTLKLHFGQSRATKTAWPVNTREGRTPHHTVYTSFWYSIVQYRVPASALRLTGETLLHAWMIPPHPMQLNTVIGLICAPVWSGNLTNFELWSPRIYPSPDHL